MTKDSDNSESSAEEFDDSVNSADVLERTGLVTQDDSVIDSPRAASKRRNGSTRQAGDTSIDRRSVSTPRGGGRSSSERKSLGVVKDRKDGQRRSRRNSTKKKDSPSAEDGDKKKSSRLTSFKGSVGRSSREMVDNSQVSEYTTMTGDGDGSRKKKSKMEKIEQLQAKNALYKEEFKRVQKDRKHLKKDIENKRLELESLSKEIDSYIAETSNLKSQLSDALQQVDRNEEINANAVELAGEVSKLKAELDISRDRFSQFEHEIGTLRTQLEEKDAEIQKLKSLVKEQAQTLQEHVTANKSLKEQLENVPDNTEQIRALEEENDRVQKELTVTLERAAAMVKEREDAIADLLKENDDMKSVLEMRENDNSEGDEKEEQLLRLRDALGVTTAALEETQDRNVMMEEELEGWIDRGREMEKEVQRLQDEMDVLERKLVTAEQTAEAAEAEVEKAVAAADSAHLALKLAEDGFEKQINDITMRHKSALFAAKTKYAEERAKNDSNEGADAVDQQAMLLKAAMANKKEDKKGNAWFGFKKGGGSEDDLDPKDKRIRELEAEKADQDDEIKKLKSELVRLRSTYNETIYVNKKQKEKYDHERSGYLEKIEALQDQLAMHT